ncbi:MAG: FtsW/RodA/SpoVE family cell cycle protein, partial [Eggerthellaceae bacterium]|nr:FtsW/RodA/SpoVE family cell cycle protein [Eggerthellaceae bacterium]
LLFLQSLLLVLIPLMLQYRLQSDLGTTIICFVGILAIMWLGEVPLPVFFGILVAGVGLALLASFNTEYRAERLIFLNPWNDGKEGLGDGYQLIHSFYAFSEGGIFGVGLGNSREKFLYLPQAESDFIFAIIGEELGLLGALIVIGLFLCLLYAGMRIARKAPDDFGMLIAGGLTVIIVFQAFLNMGCAIGVVPTTGKPLPFISSGGSSLIASLAMLGIVLSVSRGAVMPDIHEQRRADLRVIRVQEQPAVPERVQKAPARYDRSEYAKISWPKKVVQNTGEASQRTQKTTGTRPAEGQTRSRGTTQKTTGTGSAEGQTRPQGRSQASSSRNKRTGG